MKLAQLLEQAIKLEWEPLVKIIGDHEAGESDWNRFVVDVTNVLTGKGRSTQRRMGEPETEMAVPREAKLIWYLDENTVDQPNVYTHDWVYELVFQEVFGCSANTDRDNHYTLPEGCTKENVDLEVYPVGSNDFEQSLDHGGTLIKKNGKPVLLLSYPHDAGVCFYWLRG